MAKKPYASKCKKPGFKPIKLSPGVEKALREKQLKLKEKFDCSFEQKQRQPGPEPRGMLPYYSMKKVERILSGVLSYEKVIGNSEPLVFPPPLVVFSSLRPKTSKNGRLLQTRAVKVASFSLA